MARRSRQSILKRQRELRRAEKAALKRQKREERRQRSGSETEGPIDDESHEEADDGERNEIPDAGPVSEPDSPESNP